MSNNKNAAIDFLLYSYFGITSDCTKEEMLDASIKRAYLDTCRTLSFPACEKFEKNDTKGFYFFTKVSEIICGKIKELPTKDYQEWHKKTCGDIIDTGISSDMKAFYGAEITLTYGHAQKLVNMTMKYLYLLEALLEKKFVSCDWSQLHVPIDGYIIEAFDSNSEEKTKNILGTATWSNIEESKKYKDYQEALKAKAGNITPIEWEGSAWIKVAKSREKAEQEKRMKRLEELMQVKY